MFKNVALALILGIGVCVWSGGASPAWAEDETTEVFLTPRLWYSFVSTAHVYPRRGTSVDNSTVPLYGGSITVAPAIMRGTTFSLTALSGTGSGDFHGADTCCGYTDGNDRQRLDVDAVVQFPIDATGAYWWSMGLRYIDTSSDARGTDQSSMPFRFITNQEVFLHEIGLGGQTFLDASGSHRFFGGLTLVAGQKKIETRDTSFSGFSGTTFSRHPVAGIDATLGYAASLGTIATFYARYRLLVLSEMNQFASPDMLDLVHGPEVNLSIKLN